MELHRARWSEADGVSLAVVSLGSTEQHGPHLPLGSDTEVAIAVARGVAAELGPGVIIAPALPYGSSGEHQDFAGTVSIGREALSLVLAELVRSLGTWVPRVLLVTGHGGNVPVLAAVVPALRAEGHDLAWAACAPSGGDAHAGRTETSLLLHLDATLVREDLAEPGNTRPIGQLMPELMARGVRSVAPNGILGDPAGASATEGARLLDEMVADAAAAVRSWSPDASGRLR